MEESDFKYRCGLSTGNRLMLKKPLQIVQVDGTPVSTHLPGLEWLVLAPGFDLVSESYAESVVWLREPEGYDHTWNDDGSIFDFFEIICGSSTR
jgi:hypothetical protein